MRQHKSIRKIFSGLVGILILTLVMTQAAVLPAVPFAGLRAAARERTVQNLAKNKPVTAAITKSGNEAVVSQDKPLTNIVNGVCTTNDYGEFGQDSIADENLRSMYVQVDLEKTADIQSVKLWRYFEDQRTYEATVVAVSNNESFSEPTILYNSDQANVHGFGAGQDQTYQETAAGKTLTLQTAVTGRYVRVYGYGLTSQGQRKFTNHIVELEVNGTEITQPSEAETADDEAEANDGGNPQSPGSDKKELYLSDLRWKSAVAGDQNIIRLNRSYDQAELKLKVAGQIRTFAKGIGTHAGSQIVYNVEGKGYERFQAYVGLDQETLASYQQNNQEGIVRNIRVSFDRGEGYTHEAEINPTMDALRIDIAVPADAKLMTLSVDAGEVEWSDHVDWADAKFVLSYPQAVNLALEKPVSLKKKDGSAAPGNHDRPAVMATDGNKDTLNYAELGADGSRESLYAEVDLKATAEIESVALFRYFADKRTYAATVVAVSENADFSNPTILYNSDTNDVHGLGKGTEEVYQETAEGRTFTPKNHVYGRYIRVYVYGNSNASTTNHIVEIEVNGWQWQEEEPDEAAASPFKNAKSHIDVPVVYPNPKNPGMKNYATHPDVVDMGQDWNGYRYWMGYTPNMHGTSWYENPCILASHDGESWETPQGLTNPVQPRFDPAGETNESEHNCDTDLLYDAKNDRFILYWQWAKDTPDSNGKVFAEIRARVSYDGIHWGTQIEGRREVQYGERDYYVTLRTDDERYSDLSPTYVYDAASESYLMWANDTGDTGYPNKTNRVWMMSSKDPLSFSKETVKANQPRVYTENFLGADENGTQLLPWHQDIQWIKELHCYLALSQAFPNDQSPDATSLRFTKSIDGVHWTPMTEKPIVSVTKNKPGENKWDSGQIYRSTYWFERATAENGYQAKLHIIYAGLNKGQIDWYIGKTEAAVADTEAYLGQPLGMTAARKALRRVIDRDHPLYLENYYWSDDLRDKHNQGGSFQSLNETDEDRVDSPLKLWETVPESLKENTVILLIPERSLNNTVQGQNPQAVRQWVKHNVELCNQNKIPVAVQCVNGETRSDDTIPLAFWEELAEANPYLIGFNAAEMYNRFNGDNRDYVMQLIRSCAANGLTMLWTDTNIFGDGEFKDKGVLYEWLEKDDRLSSLMRENKEYIAMIYKESYGRPDTEALYLGMWLAGYCANWGIASDWWHWQLDGNGSLFGQRTAGDAWKQCFTWPENLYSQDIIRSVSMGATCFKSEAQWYSNGSKGKRLPAYQYSLIPTLQGIVDGSIAIPSMDEVKQSVKYVAIGRDNWNDFYYNKEKSQLYPATGRYGIIPYVPASAPQEALADLPTGSAPISKEAMDALYSQQYDGNGWLVRQGKTSYFMNSSEDVDEEQTASFAVESFGGSQLTIKAAPHAYAVLTEKTDRLNVKLSNYRIDKSELWDGTIANGFNDSQAYEYTWQLIDRMEKGTQKDTEKRETVLTLWSETKPELTERTEGTPVEFRADHYSRPYSINIAETGEVQTDGKKQWQIIVAHNGYVEFDLLTKQEEPQPQPNPEKATYHMSYDLNGGTLNGRTGVVVIDAKEGDTIILPDAPTRAGYRFTYWKGSRYMPGDKYVVRGHHTFTAQWEKSEENKKPDDSDANKKQADHKKPDGNQTKADHNRGKTVPGTGDGNRSYLWLGLSGICAAVICVLLFIRVRKKK
ncbi:MAG: NPCBM/NEW2 domain-containing protein [Lachnospiraceae bacterium]|nr:NPCBM/NEW2 domain-containing protein [Lachnospiraceae bacterium]MDY5742685.1 NPCBM/NEW2 domain-containing protein [Lachnospiraceae bacterium]